MTPASVTRIDYAELLARLVQRASELDRDAVVFSTGMHRLYDEIVGRGFDAMVIFTLARELQLDAEQQDLLAVYRGAVMLARERVASTSPPEDRR